MIHFSLQLATRGLSLIFGSISFNNTLNIKVFQLPSGRRGFPKHHQVQSVFSHE